jgi:hypothetical protein
MIARDGRTAFAVATRTSGRPSSIEFGTSRAVRVGRSGAMRLLSKLRSDSALWSPRPRSAKGGTLPVAWRRVLSGKITATELGDVAAPFLPHDEGVVLATMALPEEGWKTTLLLSRHLVLAAGSRHVCLLRTPRHGLPRPSSVEWVADREAVSVAGWRSTRGGYFDRRLQLMAFDVRGPDGELTLVVPPAYRGAAEQTYESLSINA